jgi:plastocyanin
MRSFILSCVMSVTYLGLLAALGAAEPPQQPKAQQDPPMTLPHSRSMTVRARRPRTLLPRRGFAVRLRRGFYSRWPAFYTLRPMTSVVVGPYEMPYDGAASYQAPYSTLQSYEEPNEGAASNAPPASKPAASGRTVQVLVTDQSFEPSTINIRTGTTVEWTNVGEDIESVTSDENPWMFSAQLTPHDVFRYTFKRAGDYPYHSMTQIGMDGTVMVR